jgi:hypothetical protein
LCDHDYMGIKISQPLKYFPKLTIHNQIRSKWTDLTNGQVFSFPYHHTNMSIIMTRFNFMFNPQKVIKSCSL